METAGIDELHLGKFENALNTDDNSLFNVEL